jgi:glycosyltransferase involved in cell wall biosynthesis
VLERVLVIVPALNEAASVGQVVAELRALPDAPDVVVLDDGSSDRTAAIAAGAGARVVRMPFNCGIGATIQAGLRMADRDGYDAVVRVDGDGQHAAGDVPLLLRRLREERADFVVGSRYLEGDGYQGTAVRRLGIRWFSGLLRLFCGVRSTDPTSGFWAANRKAVKVLLAESSADYPEVDALVYLARSGCRIREVAVAMRARTGGRSSIGGGVPLYYMIKVTVGLLIGRVRRRRHSSSLDDGVAPESGNR